MCIAGPAISVFIEWNIHTEFFSGQNCRHRFGAPRKPSTDARIQRLRFLFQSSDDSHVANMEPLLEGVLCPRFLPWLSLSLDVDVDVNVNVVGHVVGIVDLWINLWMCESLDLWPCGSVDLWICGSVDL
jgi:hypothetical protein